MDSGFGWIGDWSGGVDVAVSCEQLRAELGRVVGDWWRGRRGIVFRVGVAFQAFLLNLEANLQ